MNRIKTKRLTATALLAALVFLLGLTPYGLIPLGFINVTVLCVPVLLGTLLLGLKSGLVLGFCFGTASLFSLLGLAMTPPSALAFALLGESPALAVLMCYAPRLLVPLVANGVYALRRGAQKPGLLAAAAALGSLTNTALYLGLMLLGYALSGLSTQKVLALIGGVALSAGSAEALVCALLVPAIATALQKTRFMKGLNA